MPRGLKIILAIALAIMTPAIALSITASIPLDLEAVDAEHAPFVMRDGRRVADDEHSCGFTALPPDGPHMGKEDCAPVDVEVDEEEVTIPSSIPETGGPRALAGTVSKPRGVSGKRPAALLLHGSGPTNRDGDSPGDLLIRHDTFPLLREVAQLLSRRGVVVLRYDKRSCGACYPGKLDTARFRYQHLLTDARDALDHLRERQDVDAGRIIVVGHSEGGQLAPHLAHDASLAGAIMLAGSTGPLRGTLIGQLERLANMRLGRFDLLSYIQIRAQAANYRSCFDALSGDFEDDEVCLGGGVTQRTLFEAEELFAQSMGIIERLEAPLCVIQGALDRNVLPENAFALRDALRARDAEVHFIAGVGHSLVDGYHPEPPKLAPAVADAIVGFVANLRAR